MLAYAASGRKPDRRLKVDAAASEVALKVNAGFGWVERLVPPTTNLFLIYTLLIFALYPRTHAFIFLLDVLHDLQTKKIYIYCQPQYSN